MENLNKGLNEQFNFEIESGYIYLSMSAYCKDRGMDGFAHFLYEQAKEEFEHAEKFYNYLFEIDVKPVYEGIEKPEADFGTFLEVFQTAYGHEQEVTRRINALYDKALEVNDHRAISLLQWFVDEQVEEEDNFRGIIERLERIDESWNGLYIYDRELAQR
ncbi:MAG: ferritin [Tissierellia bacterium]|nr:ferritin [Tissierellia bacterium]